MFAGGGIALVENPCGLQFFAQNSDDVFFYVLDSGTQDLERQKVSILIYDQAGKEIRFTENQSAGIGFAIGQQVLPRSNGSLQFLLVPGFVDHSLLVPFDQSDGYPGLCIVV